MAAGGREGGVGAPRDPPGSPPGLDTGHPAKKARSQYAEDCGTTAEGGNSIPLQAHQGDSLTESTVSCCENPTGAMP